MSSDVGKHYRAYFAVGTTANPITTCYVFCPKINDYVCRNVCFYCERFNGCPYRDKPRIGVS